MCFWLVASDLYYFERDSCRKQMSQLSDKPIQKIM